MGADATRIIPNRRAKVRLICQDYANFPLGFWIVQNRLKRDILIDKEKGKYNE